MIELDLEVSRGAFHLAIACTLAAPWTVIFGPSGAGKSTLLRLIAGLDLPDHGRISIDGEYVLDTVIGLNRKPGQKPDQRRVGFIAQQPTLFPHLTAFQNVIYGLSFLSKANACERAAAILDMVGAAEFADRLPCQLSGGQAQRVALARAIAPSPRLLLLDEPFSALDGYARDEVLFGLKAWLQEQRIAAVLVTHDAADAIATHAEVAVIDAGRLTALGPAQTVLAAEQARLLSRLGIQASGAATPDQPHDPSQNLETKEVQPIVVPLPRSKTKTVSPPKVTATLPFDDL